MPVAVITSELNEIFKIGMRYQRIWIKSALKIYVMETACKGRGVEVEIIETGRVSPCL